jgi:hypothetical protein
MLNEFSLCNIMQNTAPEIAGRLIEANEKTAIFPLSHGIDFLGFHHYLTQSGKVIRKVRRDG